MSDRDEYLRFVAEQEAESFARQAEQAEGAIRELADASGELAYERDMALDRAEKAESTLAAIRAALAPALALSAAGSAAPWDNRGVDSPRDLWAGDGRYIGELDHEEDAALAVSSVNAVRALAELLKGDQG